MANHKYHKFYFYGCLISMLSLSSEAALATSMRNYTEDNTGRPKVEIDLNAVHDIENSDDVFIDHSSFDGETVTHPKKYTDYHNQQHMDAHAVIAVERENLAPTKTQKPVIRPFKSASAQKPVLRPVTLTNAAQVSNKAPKQQPTKEQTTEPQQKTIEEVMVAHSIGPIARPPMDIARIQPARQNSEDTAPEVQPHPQAQEITPKAVIEAEQEAAKAKETEKQQAEKETVKETVQENPKAEKKTPLVAPAIPETPKAAAPINPALKDKQTARILFNGADAELTAEHKKILDQQITIMKKSPTAKLMIETYANGKEAQRISILRGFAVRIYLMDQGIGYERMQFTPRGNNTDITPIDRVDLYIVQ